jgi:D-beta-D-heptose 7-phosphate kinase/D-beta-D-heptose 1-phosphate adenosyltransferase
MNHRLPSLSPARIRRVLSAATKTPIMVIGDVMLDHFIWGNVSRISPEAPVPVVDFLTESHMPGGAANVARNVAALKVQVEMVAVSGEDDAARILKRLLQEQGIGCDALTASKKRATSVKTRIVAHKQQVVRIDRESREALNEESTMKLLDKIEPMLPKMGAVIVCDYGKGLVTQLLLERLKTLCRSRGLWLSMDPKPVHHLDLSGLSLITPNRKEAFELARISDDTRNSNPLADKNLMAVAQTLLRELKPAILLITLGELGMLLCQNDEACLHIPTVAKEVFDVSGAGDTVIATFTLAIAGGASPLEAALLSNHAAGIVVGKIGTATVTAEELLQSFSP